MSSRQQDQVPVAVWDWPTRVFHWSVVLLVAFMWWSAEEREMEWHRRAGLVLLALVIFRLLWGFVGSSTARFSDFVRGPGRVLAYVRGMFSRHEAAGPIGHNPLGGWSVIAMLLLLLVQLVLGLFASDVDGMESGPLSIFVDFETSRRMADWHELVFDGLLVLIALHVAAVVFHLAVKRDNLVRPMLTGRRMASAETVPMKPAGWARMAIVAAISVAISWWVSNGLSF